MQPILTINLSNGAIGQQTIPADWERDYLGGSALAARILYPFLLPEVDPFDPAAPLLFLNGPLSGTAGPAVGRFVVCGRSPATRLWAESNCGGFWGPELRQAGFDGLLVTGQAASPSYIWIENQQVELRSAAHLWGLETYATQEAVVTELGGRGKPRVLTIGPAGELHLPFALIHTDHGRMAGRTGLGAVMGAKLLKAVAVRGKQKIPLPVERFAPLRQQANKELRADNFSRAARELGSAGVADYADYLGEMPKKYFQSGEFAGVEKVSGATMSETILTGVSACHACVIACGRVVQLPDEQDHRKGPEYETIVGFGPNLLIDDLPFIVRMGDLCDNLGMDTISLTNTLGLAFKLFEQGRITNQDTDGISLNWGNQQVVERLVRLTAQRAGFGAYLAEGARALAARFGAPDEAVEVNGLEVAYHDPRAASGMAIVYATSPRGACHNQSDYFLPDVFGQSEESLGMQFFDRHAGAEKAANVAIHQDWRTVFNALVICFFANVPPQTVLDLTNAVTGQNYSLPELLQIGERAWNLKRLINHRFGLTAQDDRLPKGLLKAYSEGGSAGYHIPFKELMAAYYQARDWDAQSGYPNARRLAVLGLEWVQQAARTQPG